MQTQVDLPVSAQHVRLLIDPPTAPLSDTPQSVTVDFCQAVSAQSTPGKVLDAHRTFYDSDRFRDDINQLLDNWAQHPISPTASVGSGFQYRNGKSVWWTSGPGCSRQATRGPLVPAFRQIWIACRALEQLRPASVEIHCEDRRVLRALTAYCLDQGIQVQSRGSAKPAALQRLISASRQLSKLSLHCVGLCATPLWLVARALATRWAVRGCVDKQQVEAATTILTSWYPRHFRHRDGVVDNTYWETLTGEMPKHGLKPAYLLYVQRRGMRLRLLRKLSREITVLPLPQQQPCLNSFVQAVPAQLAMISRLAGAIMRDGFRNAPRLRGCEVHEWILPRLLSAVCGAALWERNVAAFAAVMRLASRAHTVLVTEEFYPKGMQVCAAAERLGMHSIGVQHGLIAPGHLMYTPSRSAIEGMPLPSQMAVYGEYSAKVISEFGCYPRERSHVVGASQLDGLVHTATAARTEHASPGSPARQAKEPGVAVLVATQPSWNRNRGTHPAMVIMDALRQLDEVTDVCIKMHPNDRNRDVYHQAARRSGVVIRFADSNPQELLAACDLLITGASTMILEALMLKRAVLCIPAETQTDIFPYTDSPLVFEATTVSGVVSRFQQALAAARCATADSFLQSHLGPTVEGGGARSLAQLIVAAAHSEKTSTTKHVA